MTTPILDIEEMAASQAQPELIVNEAIRILEAFGNIPNAISATTTAPPGSPSDGDLYIIPPGATGVWSSKDTWVALYASTDWIFRQPRPGWLAYVADTDTFVRFAAGSPSAWIAFP